MRKFITIILLCAITDAFCQSPKRARTAGDELIKAGNMYYTGAAFSVLGAIILVTTNDSKVNKRSFERAPYILGAGMAGLGAILSFVSHTHIIKAGKIMNSKKTALKFDKDGVGLAINF